MKLRKDLVKGIQRFLNQVDATTRGRGREYFINGHVKSVVCQDPDHLYLAAVQGSKDYTVRLKYANGDWLHLDSRYVRGKVPGRQSARIV